jgi:hypothetical protein
MRAALLLLFATLALNAHAQTSLSSAQPQPEPEPQQAAPPPMVIPPDALPKVPVTDAERSAITITAYDLDLHLIPAASREETRAVLTVRNTSSAPLARIPLQISSTLRFERITAASKSGLRPVDFTQSPIGTDADHTGFAQEAILTPAEPLAPDATLTLSVLYSGAIKPSAERLELLGTDPDRAAQSDWDAVLPTSDLASTALRGFGNVLWYPVAEPAAALGDGNKLFALIQQVRAADSAVTMRLRLTVEYAGDPPDSAIFNGDLQPLTRTPDTSDTTVEETHGIATAAWAAASIGFRIPSLFLTAQHAAATPDQLLDIITADSDAIPPYTAGAKLLTPLLTAWFGEKPASLLLLNHKGEPFADHAFLAAQLAPDARAEDIAPSLAGPLAEAWLPSSHPWINEGFAQFFRLLYTERTKGRATALADLVATNREIAFVEPDLSQPNAPFGQPLITATSDTYLRLKAAFVWWQLRDLVSEATLQQAIAAYRKLSRTAEADPHAFETTLEAIAKTDLAWFFSDWVYRDRGLPDLSIVQATPRPLPSRGGKDAGYVVAVNIHNDGDAIADVPVTLSSHEHTLTQRMRIPPHASADTRILFEDVPELLTVNDGSVPEQQTTTHSLKILAPGAP